MPILTSVGPSICPHISIQELLNEFLLNLILARNTNIFRHIPLLVLVVVVVVVVHVDDVRYVPELRPRTGLLFIPQMIYDWKTTVE
jgi:hypothetical protein